MIHFVTSLSIISFIGYIRYNFKNKILRRFSRFNAICYNIAHLIYIVICFKITMYLVMLEIIRRC